jgi:hypothetical protein
VKMKRGAGHTYVSARHWVCPAWHTVRPCTSTNALAHVAWTFYVPTDEEKFILRSKHAVKMMKMMELGLVKSPTLSSYKSLNDPLDGGTHHPKGHSDFCHNSE